MCVSKVKRQPTEWGEMFANHAAALKSTENGHRTAIKTAAAQFQTRQETRIEAIPEICWRPVSSPRYSSRKDHNNAQRRREIRTILHCWQECCNSKFAPDNSLAIYSKKLNVKESNGPASPLLAICPGEMNVCLYKTTCINAHSSTAHKSQKKKKNGKNWQVHQLRNGGRDVVHLHNGILLSHTNTCLLQQEQTF